MKQFLLSVCIVLQLVSVYGAETSLQKISKTVDEVLVERWPALPEETKSKVNAFYHAVFTEVEEAVDIEWFVHQVEVDLSALEDQVVEAEGWVRPFSKTAIQEAVKNILNYPEGTDLLTAELASRIQYVFERTSKLLCHSKTWAFPAGRPSPTLQLQEIMSGAQGMRNGQFIPSWAGSIAFEKKLATAYLQGLLDHTQHLLQTTGEYAIVGFRTASESIEDFQDERVFFQSVDEVFERLSHVDSASDLGAFQALMFQVMSMTWKRNDVNLSAVVGDFIQLTEDRRLAKGEFLMITFCFGHDKEVRK